jgi:arylsulfatase A-like enzyme
VNVIIIMTDQQKASSLPMYGNPIVKAPVLEKLAREGSLFENAYTSCPICVPARVSLFTGQYPSTHGSLNNNILMLPDKDHLLKLVKDAGMATGLAGKNHCFRPDDMAYFDSAAECGHYGPVGVDPESRYAKATEFLRRSTELKGAWGHVKNPFPPEALGTAWVTDRAIEFVRDHAADPFFLWYSIPDPHIPFQTADPYATMYPPESVDLPPRREGEMEGKPRAHRIDHDVMRGAEVEERTIRDITSLYYGMNTFIDTELGRFFGVLEELNLMEETLIVYVSDHGEYLGEHEMIRKSKAAYDCLTCVPFLIKAPGLRTDSIPAFVSLEDVMPTVLSWLKMPVPDTVQGRDLLPLLRGEGFDDRGYAYGEYGAHTYPVPEDTEYAVCETPLSPDFRPVMKLGGYGKMRYIRTGRWKLAAYVQDRYELYDLDADPYELENIYGTPGTEEITRDLERQLIEEMMIVNSPGEPPPGVS